MTQLSYNSLLLHEDSRSEEVVSTKLGRNKFQIESLSVWYGSKPVLHRIHLNIPEHSITALIGPSGSGKTTFLRMLNRLSDLVPDVRHTGRVLLDGLDIHAPNANLTQLRRRVGMVFQKATVFPKSIFENVAFGPRMAGIHDRKILAEISEKCLRAVALWEEVKDRLQELAMNLSSGQQQRLCIARALATAPEVLLLDEPASALDSANTARIEDLLFELKRDYTIILVTHNMQQAARISDQTAFFLEGRLIEMGPTAQLYTRPRDRQTEDYITGRFG
jgi:phosphate transport system ATP-binding protein